MLNNLFPLKLHLHVLQLEGYNLKRFFYWVKNNLFVRSLEKKKPLVWTQKVRLLAILTLCYMVLLNTALFVWLSLPGLFIALFITTQTYLFLMLSVVTLKPYEYINRLIVRRFIKNKITRLKSKGLVVIGITGSFGKTTTKEFLYEMLKTEHKVLKTPESYNTLLGIYRVVDLELSDRYEIFICEMGAYHRGEIAELCDVVMPDHGILTGINEQHLERFGSIQNTIKAKFELIEALPEDGFKILNGDNENVLNNYKAYVKVPILYGENSKANYYTNVAYSSGSLSMDLFIDGHKIPLSSVKVIGRGNLSNILASAVLSGKLGISEANIKKAIAQIKPVPHRLEVKVLPDKTLIDNAYSSNVEGFKVALELLASYKDRPRIIVTPGIVELGDKTESIHMDLGKLVDDICDFAILVGDSERTRALASSISSAKVKKMPSINDLTSMLESLTLDNPVILIENDLPENY